MEKEVSWIIQMQIIWNLYTRSETIEVSHFGVLIFPQDINIQDFPSVNSVPLKQIIW
jgi:hypothetical protein